MRSPLEIALDEFISKHKATPDQVPLLRDAFYFGVELGEQKADLEQQKKREGEPRAF